MKYSNVIQWFLGASMFAFGFLKFFDPFHTWYSVQVAASGLGEAAYVSGIAGELAVGLVFLALAAFGRSVPPERYALLSALASAGVIAMMAAAVYVHLHDSVPAAVLPLKMKPPFIPLAFLAAAAVNIVVVRKAGAIKKNRQSRSY